MVRLPSPPRFLGSIALYLLAIGCAGGQSTTETPPPPAADPPEAVASAQTPSAPAPSADEAWEGEAEAKAGKTAGNSQGPENRTNEVIARVIKENRKPFRDCYEKNVKDVPETQGTLTLHFVLDPEGKVKEAELNELRSTIKAASVVTCAVGVLKGMKFPASSRGMETSVNYPFDFKR